MIFEVFEKKVRHRIDYIMKQKSRFKNLEISVISISPCMADISVSASKKHIGWSQIKWWQFYGKYIHMHCISIYEKK